MLRKITSQLNSMIQRCIISIKKGVFAYGLQDRETKKLSAIQAKDMTITDNGIVIVGSKGKKTHFEKVMKKHPPGAFCYISVKVDFKESSNTLITLFTYDKTIR